MRFTQVRKLKKGDRVIFKTPFPEFEVGKKYRISSSDEFGVWVRLEHGRCYCITEPTNMGLHFDFLDKVSFSFFLLL